MVAAAARSDLALERHSEQEAAADRTTGNLERPRPPAEEAFGTTAAGIALDEEACQGKDALGAGMGSLPGTGNLQGTDILLGRRSLRGTGIRAAA